MFADDLARAGTVPVLLGLCECEKAKGCPSPSSLTSGDGIIISPIAWLSLLAVLSSLLSCAGVIGGVGRGGGFAGEVWFEEVKGELGSRSDRLFFLANICERRLRCDVLAMDQRLFINC
jgi:hypothetical protein